MNGTWKELAGSPACVMRNGAVRYERRLGVEPASEAARMASAVLGDGLFTAAGPMIACGAMDLGGGTVLVLYRPVARC